MTNKGLNSSWIRFAAKGCARFSSPMKEAGEQAGAAGTDHAYQHQSHKYSRGVGCNKLNPADISWDLISRGSIHLLMAIWNVSLQTGIQLQIRASALRCPPVGFFWYLALLCRASFSGRDSVCSENMSGSPNQASAKCTQSMPNLRSSLHYHSHLDHTSDLF